MSIEERPTTPTRLSRTWTLLTFVLVSVLCLSIGCSPDEAYDGAPGREPTGLELFLFFALFIGVPLVWYIVRQMEEEAKSRERVEERREQRREEERAAEWSAKCKELAEREKGENQTDEAGSEGKPASGPQGGGDFSI